MTPNHNHNPHHRHMLGSPLFDRNNLNGSQGGGGGGNDAHQNPNLAQIMNMMQQSPVGGLPPHFNPYRHQPSPHQRFPAYLNPAVAAGYNPADIMPGMRFNSQSQPPLPPPQPSQFYGHGHGHSPVSSPEEMRKRAVQAQAHQQQAQAQAQAQGFYNNFPGPRHLGHPQGLMNRAAGGGGGSSFFGSAGHQQAAAASFSQFGAGQVGGVNEPSMPPLPQSAGSQFGSFLEQQQAAAQQGNLDQDLGSEASSKSPEKSVAGGVGAGSPEKPSLESIVNSLSSPNGSMGMKGTGASSSDVGVGVRGGAADVDLTPLGTILNSSPDSGGGRGRGRGGPGRGGRGGRGRGRGRGRGKRGILSLTKTQPDGTIVPIDAELGPDGSPEKMPVYYTGSVSLGLEEDQYWLSELQVYLRSNFAEAFGATEKDIAAPMHGRNKPIALGQVGIRCIHCKNEPATTRGQQAVSYPSLVSGIYNSVQQMFRLHFDCCTTMPPEVKAKIETLRASSSSRGGRKQYWIDSAKRLGLVDTPHGIHFGRDPTGPLPPLSGPSAAVMEDVNNIKPKANTVQGESPSKNLSLLSQEHTDEIKRQKEEAYPLVLPEDQPLISEYLYITLQQMEPCKLMDADRVGCYKGREMGFRGLACKWCVGQAGCGRYFPASEASLSQTTTSQTILNHVRNCRRCPAEIRDNLEVMKRTKTGPDGKKYEKPKHGGRKVFFHRLWCRIQGLEIEEIHNVEVKIGRQKGAKNKTPSKRRKKKKKAESDTESDSDAERPKNKDEEETETEDEDDKKPRALVKRRHTSLGRKRSIGHIAAEDEESSVDETSDSEDLPDVSLPGCVTLNKPDDAHWLSELQCYIRSDLVEAFSVTAEDIEAGLYSDVEELQVGIRCKFCGTLPLEDRPEGHYYFPHSISGVQSCVSDLHRRHFSSCNEMPEDVRKAFKSLRGFTGKAEGETQQYWIDSARELGLSNKAEANGIRFFRVPTDQSPADELEKERSMKQATSLTDNKKSLIRPNDVATNHALLLLKQVRPCRFKNSDRRGGPGSRGRDRALGFPGIACIHCSSKNNFGRYFPFAAKSLGDNTYNSIQSHIGTCTRCPEAVKASLAYLSHRSTLEKAELGGGWKKSFFKAVWDRLHIERAWTSKPAKENSPEETSFASEDEVTKAEGADAEIVEESLDSEIGEMVKAAAQWLTDRDADNESSHDKSAKRAQRRGLQNRSLPSRFGQGGKGAKRQKV